MSLRKPLVFGDDGRMREFNPALGDRLPLSTVSTIASSGAAQTLTASVPGAVYDVTLTANCAFTLQGGAAGLCPSLLLFARGGAGGFTPSFVTAILWTNATAPSGTVGAGQVFRAVIETPDGGATWIGSY